MKIVTLAVMAAAGAAGYLGARRLLEGDEVIRRVPEPARPPLHLVRGYLLQARDHCERAWREAETERVAAELELMAEYHARLERPTL